MQIEKATSIKVFKGCDKNKYALHSLLSFVDKCRCSSINFKTVKL